MSMISVILIVEKKGIKLFCIKSKKTPPNIFLN